MVTVSVQDFRTLVLPIVYLGPVGQTLTILDDQGLDLIRTCCVTNGLIDSKSRWTRFAEVLDPFTADNEEVSNSFRDLWSDVIERVVDLHPGTKPLVQFAFRSITNLSPVRVCVVESKGPTTNTALTSSGNTRWFWENIITVVEFEKNAAAQMSSHCTSILQNDPCRRFTFGITIESTEMRLWHFSRSGVIVTEPINWIEDHATVIHVFTSLAFATKTDLGYDPTIKRVLVGEAIQYEITMPNGDTYVTDGSPLLDADVGPGRATRVWKVFKKGGDRNDHFALKDLWIFSDSKSEGEIMRNLLNKVDKKDHHYFLTIVSDGQVRVDGGRVDKTFPTIMRAIPTIIDRQPIEPPHTYDDPKPNVLGSQRNQFRCRPSGVKQEYSIELHEGDITPRTHYRIVFREVCEPLHDIRDLGKAFSLLHQTCDVLRILHKHRIVHGDLSTGNILCHKGTVKLADLEYSRRIDDERKNSVRTGTAEFMPIEVYARKHFFKSTKTTKRMKARPPKIVKPFKYGMIHDLESVWWIAVWFLFRTHPTGTTVNPGLHSVAGAIFSGNYDTTATRIELMCGEDGWATAADKLPSEFSEVASRLDSFRDDYVEMATATNSTLSAEGVAEKIVTKHTDDDEKLDAYTVAQFYLESPTISVALINTPPAPKRKEAPELENKPEQPSKRTRQQSTPVRSYLSSPLLHH